MNDLYRMSLRHRNRSCLGRLLCVGLFCVIGFAVCGQAYAQPGYGENVGPPVSIEIDLDRVESSTAESSFSDRIEGIKRRIRERMTAEGASLEAAESIAASVAESIENDGCIDGSCRIEKRGVWRWQRPQKSDRWYPGKVLGEAAGDVYWTAKVTLFLTIACPFVIVAFFIFAIAWLIFRPRK